MFKILSYPPSLEQLSILNWFNLSGNSSLLFLRFITWIIILVTLFFWWKIVKRHFNNLIAIVSVLILLISPSLWVIGLSLPIHSFLLLVVVGIISLKPKFIWLGLLLIPLFNIYLLGNKPAVLNKLSLKDAQTEVNNRFVAEDSLIEKIVLPLWWRRISYNKFFVASKQVVAEVIPFFDIESTFFAEVTPTGDKSMVMFYWPEFFLLLFGWLFLSRDKNNSSSPFLLKIFLLALFSYVFSEGPNYLRLIGLIWPFSIIISIGLIRAYRWVGIIFIVLILFGWLVNLNDINRRPDYWLDNRPLAFQFWYQNIAKLNLQDYSGVQISSRVGDSRVYCKFYLGENCQKINFIYNSFDLFEETPKPKIVYAGFAGEFVGSKFKNDISADWVNITKSKGFKLINFTSLRDTIAYKYGNDIGLFIKE